MDTIRPAQKNARDDHDELTRAVLSTLEAATAASPATSATLAEPDETRDDAEDEATDDFNVYQSIKDALVARGIPADEIAFIQHHATKTKRAALCAAMNSGQKRVLLVSKQNTGLNVQERLIAVHNFDVPWRPGDLEQRLGRVQRQGNMWPEVYAYNYATEGSFDSYMWQCNHVKAQFIAQFERGDVSVREIDDVGGMVLSAAEMKAIASGNPRIVRKVEIETEIARLDGLYTSQRDTHARMRWALRDHDFRRERLQLWLAIYTSAQNKAAPYADAKFRVALTEAFGSEKAVAFDKREEAGAALLQILADALDAANKEYERYLKEANKVAFGDVPRARGAMRHIAPIEWERTIGAYCGVMICAHISSRSGAEVFLAVEHDGGIERVPNSGITAEHAKGVFQSIDSRIRRIESDIDHIQQEFATIAAEETKLQTALQQPWEYEQQYSDLRGELDAINAELGIGKQEHLDDTDIPLSGEHTATQAPEDGGDRPGVEPQDAGKIDPETVLMMVHPQIIIPAPQSAEAMEAAHARIIALDDSRVRRDAVSAQKGVVPAAVAGVQLDEEATAELISIVFAPEDVIIPASVPVSFGREGMFGNRSLIEQSRKRGSKKERKGTPVAIRTETQPTADGLEQLDLFSLASSPSDSGGRLSGLCARAVAD